MRTKILLVALLVLANLPTLLYAQTVDIRGYSKGQKTMANSFPFVIASDQSAIPVTQSGTWTIGLSQVGTANDVDVTSLPALPTGSNTIGGVNLSQYTPVTGRLPVDGSGVTQPVSGTVTANQGGTWTVQPGNTQNTTPWLTQPQGNVAHDVVDSGNPIKIGCHARQTNRTKVADADRADVVCDDNGQLIVTPMAPRGRVVRSGQITLATTTETTLLAAGGAGVLRDLTYLKCTNGSATLVRVDLRDATAGTVIDSWWLAANGGGFNIPFSPPYPQATANNNWTVQLSAAVTDVRCAAVGVEKN